jgi:hypothetical protein
MSEHTTSPRIAGFLGLGASPARPASKGRGLWKMLFSPSAALVLALFGYYPLANFTNIFLPEGNLGGILIRAGSFAVLLVAFISSQRDGRPKTFLFVPATVFFFFYTARLLENFYVSDIDIYPGPEAIFLLLFAVTILPANMLARVASDVQDQDMAVTLTVMNVIFLAGIALNLDMLSQTQQSRMALDKINPIMLGYTAASFLLFHLVFFQKSKVLAIAAAVSAPLLFLIIVYARSRGPYLAGAGAILVYVTLVQGPRKIWLLATLSVVSVVLIFYATEHLDIIWSQLTRTSVDGSDQSTYMHYIALSGAWQQFMDDFFFGRYAIELQTAFYPHNIFLEVPMSVGFFGLIPFAIHVGSAVRAALGILRTPEASASEALIALMFIQAAIAGCFAGAVWGASVFWVTSFLLIVFWRERQPRTRA